MLETPPLPTEAEEPNPEDRLDDSDFPAGRFPIWEPRLRARYWNPWL